MAIPEKLASVIAAWEGLISQDGELPAVERKKILLLVGDLSASEQADAAYLRRARLALICAIEVLDRTELYPDLQSSARAMLQSGIAALSGELDLKLLERENGAFHTKVIDLFEHGESAFSSVYAGMACFAAINTVLYDTNFDLTGRSEKTVSPDDWDASFYASLAVSGSAIWEKKGGVEERRAYWRWYLQTAIPYAWNVVAVLQLS